MLLWECWCGWHCGSALTARHSAIDVMRWGRSAVRRAVFVNWQGVVHESESVPEQQVLELLCATSSSGYAEVCVCVFVCICLRVCVSLWLRRSLRVRFLLSWFLLTLIRFPHIVVPGKSPSLA